VDSNVVANDDDPLWLYDHLVMMGLQE